jgi:Arc/MetJ-type ribon-helix-helix transcriptional regulator
MKFIYTRRDDMSITTEVVIKDKELEKINYFVNMGYFEDEKELIESALRKFLYELGLAEIRRRIPQAELSEEELIFLTSAPILQPTADTS